MHTAVVFIVRTCCLEERPAGSAPEPPLSVLRVFGIISGVWRYSSTRTTAVQRFRASVLREFCRVESRLVFVGFFFVLSLWSTAVLHTTAVYTYPGIGWISL